MWAGVLGTLGLAALGPACDNRVSIGTLPPSAQPDGGTPSDISWTATFEPANWVEWTTATSDLTGGGEIARGSKIAPNTTIVHSGLQSEVLSLGTGDALQYARFYRQGRFPKHARYGGWFYFPDDYTIDHYWCLIQFWGLKPGTGLLWDIDLFPGPDGMALVLYDHVTQAWRYPPRFVPMPTKTWVHIEVDYLQSTMTDGAIALYQDGVLLQKVDNVTTAFDENLEFAIGSQGPASTITPTPVLYLDDVTIIPQP